MASTFQNMATLSFNGGTVNSNVVTGHIQDVLTAAKTAVLASYRPGGTVTYVVSLTNSGTTAITGLTLQDDLGGYALNGTTLYPLAYVADSVRLYTNGILQTPPAVTAGPPMTVTGITVPAGGSALVIYEAQVTRYAPLALESTIDNTATITGGGLPDPLVVTATVGAVSAPDLSITKSLEPSVVAAGSRLTYTFVIQNHGNTAVTAGDAVILRDTFDPIIRDLTVTFNGIAWTAGTQYAYSETTGLFVTEEGQITVPAAVYAQDPVTGVWTETPGVGTLTITGTV